MGNFLSMLFTTDFFYSIFRISAPILFATLGAVVVEKAGFANIGLEGMMMVSALFGSLSAYWSGSWLVGVLAADLSLSVGDYRAGEKTFQLLTQAVGRAGRGELPGEAVIQTYQPEHYAVVQAAAQNYESFYREEIIYREMMGYPPAAHMLAVQIFSKDQERGRRLASTFAAATRHNFDSPDGEGGSPPGKGQPSGLQIIGPAPASIGRINDIFRFVFYVKCAKYDKLIQIKDLLEGEIQKRQLTEELVQFDFNPMNTM